MTPGVAHYKRTRLPILGHSRLDSFQGLEAVKGADENPAAAFGGLNAADEYP